MPSSRWSRPQGGRELFRALVTGGAGFIGRRLISKLRSRGHEVTVVDSLTRQIHGDVNPARVAAELGPGVRFVHADVRDMDVLRPLTEGTDALVHLAAETGTGQSMYEIGKYVDVNSGGTAGLLDLIVNRKWTPKRVVVASSRAVYGEGAARCAQHGIVYPSARADSDMSRGQFEARCPLCGEFTSAAPTPESAPAQPSSVYAQTKLSQEQLTLIACASANVPAIALRYQNVYGPGQSLKNPYTGILSIFSNAILADQEIRVFEDGLESRDFVFVDDVADATAAAVEAAPEVSGVFNVGSGQSTSVLAVIEELASAYGRAPRFTITGEYRKGDIRHNIADLAAVERQLGYRPSVSFTQGLSAFARWVLNEPREHSAYGTSLNELRQRGLLTGG